MTDLFCGLCGTVSSRTSHLHANLLPAPPTPLPPASSWKLSVLAQTAAFLLLSNATIHATPLALPNPGFEAGLDGWTLQDSPDAVRTVPQAASMGARGLLVEGSAGTRVRLVSGGVPFEAGRAYSLTFWSRKNDAEKPAVSVRLEFSSNDGKLVAATPAGKLWPGADVRYEGGFDVATIGATAPADATRMNVVIESRGKDSVSLDEFQLEEKTEGSAETPPAVDALVADLRAHPSSRPVKIVLKLDDLDDGKGRDIVHQKWKKTADFLIGHKVKAGFGMLANSLEGDKPNFTRWVKDLHASGNIEFWLHTYDYQSHVVGDLIYSEFNGRSLEEQTQRLTLCEKLATDKLGFPFTCFGPPDPSNLPPGALATMKFAVPKAPVEEATMQALAQTPDLRSIL